MILPKKTKLSLCEKEEKPFTSTSNPSRQQLKRDNDGPKVRDRCEGYNNKPATQKGQQCVLATRRCIHYRHPDLLEYKIDLDVCDGYNV